LLAADSSVVATGAGDRSLRLWRLGTQAELRSIVLGQGYYADAGIDTHGDTGVALVYPTEQSTLFHFFFSTMTRHAVGELSIFDVPSGSVLHRIEGAGGKVARISPDGDMVVVQSASESGLGELVVFDVVSGSPLFSLGGLCEWQPGTPRDNCGDLIAADATDLAWSPDGRYIGMAGGAAQRVIVWDTQSRSIEFASGTLGVPGFAFSAIDFSPNGATLAVSSKTAMWVYDTKTWELVRPLIPHTGRPSWVTKFTNDGSELVTAQAHSGRVRIYDTSTWEHRSLTGGVGQTRDMAVSADESMVALAANDGNVHIIDLQSGDLLELISLDDRDLTNVEFIDGDTRLLVSGSTGPVEIITLDPTELVNIARSRIARTFTHEECEFYGIAPCPTLEEMKAG